MVDIRCVCVCAHSLCVVVLPGATSSVAPSSDGLHLVASLLLVVSMAQEVSDLWRHT